VGERLHSTSPHRQGPGRLTIPEHGDREHGAMVKRALCSRDTVVWITPDVVDMDHASVDNGAAGGAATRCRPRICPQRDIKLLRRQTMVCRYRDQLTVEAIDMAECRIAEPCCTLDNGIEDRLEVGGRVADDTQDLARRRLLLQHLGQLAVAGLQLLE